MQAPGPPALRWCPASTCAPWPLKHFSANFPGSRVITSRLEDIDLVTLMKQIGRIDILLASPECTNHTCARGSAPRDERSQATAMLVVDYVRVFRPRWLVVENVIQMRKWSRYGELKHALENLGYDLEEQILDSSEFGVAQTRRRLFLMADRKKNPNLVIGKLFRSGASQPSPFLILQGSWKTSPLFNDRRRALATLKRAKRGFKSLGGKTPVFCLYTTAATAAVVGNPSAVRFGQSRPWTALPSSKVTAGVQECACCRYPN